MGPEVEVHDDDERQRMIPMLDLAGQHRALRREIEAGMREVMRSCRFLDGPQAGALEEEVAAWLEVGHAVACASGSDALLLALWMLDLGPGDEVITTPFTFFDTVEAILHAGAAPVFVDIDPLTWTLDPARVEEAITADTRVILPVHLYGQPADMPRLMRIAHRHSLHVLEDAAESFGAARNGKHTGTWGMLGALSFAPARNLGAYGDGGMILTDSADLAEGLRRLRNHGSAQPYCHQQLGFDSRLDELQAVVLRAKLKHADEYNEARRRIALRYSAALADLEEVQTPEEVPGSLHVYNCYTVRVPRRNRIHRALQARGIGCEILYPRPLHLQPALRAAYEGQSFPEAERLARQCLSLPIYPEMSEAQVDEVVAALREALATGA